MISSRSFTPSPPTRCFDGQAAWRGWTEENHSKVNRLKHRPECIQWLSCPGVVLIHPQTSGVSAWLDLNSSTINDHLLQTLLGFWIKTLPAQLKTLPREYQPSHCLPAPAWDRHAALGMDEFQGQAGNLGPC